MDKQQAMTRLAEIVDELNSIAAAFPLPKYEARQDMDMARIENWKDCLKAQSTCICGAALDEGGECPRAVELDASIRAEVSDGDTEKLPRVFPDEVFMPDDYVPTDHVDFDIESWW